MNDHRDIAVVQKIILRPYRLIDLFLFYVPRRLLSCHPETKFVLLHCGFPWVDDILSMVNGYPNLYPDLTWVPILSYTASNRILHQLIEMSQIDKICWGCDTWTVEESYGSLLAFRFSLCKVLSEKIADGYLSVNNAKDIIDKILFDNAQNIYF